MEERREKGNQGESSINVTEFVRLSVHNISDGDIVPQAISGDHGIQLPNVSTLITMHIDYHVR